jgi:hypothetical protein
LPRKITNPADLPEWFATEKYSEAVRLDARGWYEQLVTRRWCHQMVWSFAIEDGDLNEDQIYGFRPSLFLRAVREQPIFEFFGSQFEESINQNIGNWDRNDVEREPPGVNGLNWFDIRNLVHQLPTKERQAVLAFLAQTSGGSEDDSYFGSGHPKNIEWLAHPIKGGHSTPIKIDPSLPDKLLQNSFDLYLKERFPPEVSNIKGRPFRSNMFLEWCNCGLLQYMDLDIWSLETDVPISYKALAAAIFPERIEKGEENIRMTTKQHSEKILDDGIEVATFIARQA